MASDPMLGTVCVLQIKLKAVYTTMFANLIVKDSSPKIRDKTKCKRQQQQIQKRMKKEEETFLAS